MGLMHAPRAQLCLQLGHCDEPEIKNACPPDVWTQWGKERVGQTERHRVALTYVQCVCVCVCVCVCTRTRAQSCVVFATPWTAARQSPLSVGFSRQEYWSGLPFPSPGDLPCPGTEPGSPALQADSLPLAPPGKPKVCFTYCHFLPSTFPYLVSDL